MIESTTAVLVADSQDDAYLCNSFFVTDDGLLYNVLFRHFNNFTKTEAQEWRCLRFLKSGGLIQSVTKVAGSGKMIHRCRQRYGLFLLVVVCVCVLFVFFCIM